MDMERTARALVASGKGILAADESLSTIEKRFNSLGLPAAEENRRAYREMLFTTPGLGEFISGVILFDETIRQKTADGTPLVEALKRQEIIPGIKVDRGAEPMAAFPGEKITEGLDGLRERLAEYVRLGARFNRLQRSRLCTGTGCIWTNKEASLDWGGAHRLISGASCEMGRVPTLDSRHRSIRQVQCAPWV